LLDVLPPCENKSVAREYNFHMLNEEEENHAGLSPLNVLDGCSPGACLVGTERVCGDSGDTGV
jgi:hypothetical protein